MTSYKRYLFHQLLAKNVCKRPATFNLPYSVVSFAFDDFPRSALDHGGAILEAHNARGTFYVSAGLCGTSGPSGVIATQEDVRRCVERGHEIACHTYDHMDCWGHSAEEIAASIEKNQKALPYATMEHFAYPYGRVGRKAKKVVTRYYKAARALPFGINRGTMDLGMLKSPSFYSRHGTKRWKAYLQSLQKKPGWLILYTHDVEASPSQYGCTPDDLEAAVSQSLEMGYTILPIGAVLQRLAKAHPQ